MALGVKKMVKIKKYKCVFDVITLILGFASLAIALIALYSVTEVEGFKVLLKKTSENTQNLNVMITKLEKQNLLQQKNIDNNKLELNELKGQTKTLLDLQVSDANQLELHKKVDKSNLIGDYFILESLYFKIYDMKFIPNNGAFIDESYRKQTIQYLQDLKFIINQGINNSLLKMNDTIYSQWCVFYYQTENTIKSLNNELLIKKYYDIPMQFEYSLNGKIISKKEADMNTLEDFKGYLRTFWIKGVEPMFKIKEMQYYDNMYRILSKNGSILRE